MNFLKVDGKDFYLLVCLSMASVFTYTLPAVYGNGIFRPLLIVAAMVALIVLEIRIIHSCEPSKKLMVDVKLFAFILVLQLLVYYGVDKIGGLYTAIIALIFTFFVGQMVLDYPRANKKQ